MADSPRIEELRRRVQMDPASIAFAALAEEYRRIGRFDDAIQVCGAGLQRHPAYLSARVTLGRALLEIGRFDEAREELEHVLRVAPENLAATRGLAEIKERRAASEPTPAQGTGAVSPGASAASPASAPAAEPPPARVPIRPVRLSSAPATPPEETSAPESAQPAPGKPAEKGSPFEFDIAADLAIALKGTPPARPAVSKADPESELPASPADVQGPAAEEVTPDLEAAVETAGAGHADTAAAAIGDEIRSEPSPSTADVPPVTIPAVEDSEHAFSAPFSIPIPAREEEDVVSPAAIPSTAASAETAAPPTRMTHPDAAALPALEALLASIHQRARETATAAPLSTRR